MYFEVLEQLTILHTLNGARRQKYHNNLWQESQKKLPGVFIHLFWYGEIYLNQVIEEASAMDGGSFTNRILAEGCHISVGRNQKQCLRCSMSGWQGGS